MKKFLTILTTALIAIAVVSCNSEEKPNNGEVRKLPSKMIQEVPPELLITNFFTNRYFYDEQNRLIRLERTIGADEMLRVLYFTYNSDGLLINVSESANDFPITHLENGRKVIVRQDTFWLNDRGLIVRLDRQVQVLGEREVREFIRDTDGHFLNSDGNFVNIGGAEIILSDIPTVWRHVNMPEWLFYWLGFSGLVFPVFPKIGNVPKSVVSHEPLIFELDANGYVTRVAYFGVSAFRFEYILAN